MFAFILPPPATFSSNCYLGPAVQARRINQNRESTARPVDRLLPSFQVMGGDYKEARRASSAGERDDAKPWWRLIAINYAESPEKVDEMLVKFTDIEYVTRRYGEESCDAGSFAAKRAAICLAALIAQHPKQQAAQ